MQLNEHPLKYSVHTRLREFHLRRMLPDKPRGTFLDIGCGSSYLTRELSKGYDRVVGIDYDFKSLTINRQHGLNGMVRASAFELPIKDRSVQTILCSELLEHLPDGQDEQALAEMTRVLAPGGRLLITVPSLEGLRARSPLRNLGHDDPSGGEYHYRIGYGWQDVDKMISRQPLLEIVKKRYAMFLASEVFMDMLKLVYFKKNSLKEHSNIMDVNTSGLFKIYKKVFPLLHLLFVAEDIVFSSLFKGHILIVSLSRTR